jgi:hypothetical protein
MGRSNTTPPSFADAVRLESAERCVGRASEKARLALLLDGDASRVVILRGPAGIGKSTLAHWLAAQARARGGQIGWVSGEQVAPNPEAFLERVRVSKASGAPGSLSELGRGDARDLLVVDSFEALLPLARWLFTELVGELGANTLVVVATRERLPAVLRARLSLDAFVELSLEPLSELDATSLLEGCGVPAPLRPEIVSLAAGHPLALRLAAERASAGAPLHPRDEAHVVDELVRAFASSAPSPLHTRALGAASVARTLDEPLLSAMLGCDAAEVFDWMARSSLAERTELGLSPHALVRQVLFADLQTRDPELLELLQTRLVGALVPRMLTAGLSAAHDLVMQAAYAQRNRPQAAHYGAAASFDFSVVPLLEAPLPPIREAVVRFEGAAGLASFERWLPRGSLSSAIVDDDGGVAAFQMVVRLPYDATSEQLSDPVIEATWRRWRARGPSPSEGDLYLFRWFMDTERYHELSPALGHLFTLGPLLTMPRMHEIIHLAFANSPPELWGPLAPSFQLVWDREHETTFAGRRYSHVFGSIKEMAGAHWGRDDVVVCTLRDFLLRQFGLPAPALPSTSARPAQRLGRDELAKALPAFLAELGGPGSSCQSALAIALRERGLASDRAGRLAFVEAGLATLAAAPRAARSVEVLRATYFAGSAKQLAAASELGVPFGTYRYQLRKAIAALADELWPRLEAAQGGT